MYARLLHWLGPWADDSRAPAQVKREAVVVDAETPFEAWLYTSSTQPPQGAFLVAPGLHFAGPADPRLDRFLRVLAHSGFAVFAPFLPDYSRLHVSVDVVDQLGAALETFTKHAALPEALVPGLFSISFGSFPTLRLATDPSREGHVGAAVLFGGYADFGETLRFASGDRLGFEHAPANDPLNLPVIFMNVLDDIEGFAFERARVVEAWNAYVREVWGQMELKEGNRFHAVAHRHAEPLSDQERALFLLGCGVEGDAVPVCSAAISRAATRLEALDPRPHLANAHCPIYAIHGADDDVIPHSQLDALALAAPDHIELTTFLTGLYHHTGSGGLLDLVREGPVLLSEARTLLAMVRAIVAAGTVQRQS